MTLSATSHAPDPKQRDFAKAQVRDITALRTTLAAGVTDVTELRTKLAAAIVDLAAIKTKFDLAVADITEIRTKEAAAIVDLAAIKTKFDLAVADITEIRTKEAAAVVDLTAMNIALLSPPGLAISGGAKITAQAAKPIVAKIGATLVYKAAATEMAALAGVLADTKTAIWAFYIDAAGALTSAKTADADDVAAAFALLPAVPASKVQIGFVIISNAQGGATAFTGGATALDAAGVTAVYVDTVGVQSSLALTTSAPAALTTAAAPALTASAPAALTTAAAPALTASAPAAQTSSAPAALTTAI